MDTIDVIREIGLANPDIEYFRFVRYNTPRDIVRDNIWQNREERVFEKALGLRASSHVPFWESLMLTQMDEHCFSPEILKKTNYHNEVSTFKMIGPKEITHGLSLIPRLGINSMLQYRDGSTRHLPMLDFRLPFSVHNTSVAIEICRVLGHNGYIFNSGRSYHFIGMQPVTLRDLNIFLGKALLYSPIIDTTWVAHQLIDGTTTLRIGLKHGMVPELISRISAY